MIGWSSLPGRSCPFCRGTRFSLVEDHTHSDGVLRFKVVCNTARCGAEGPPRKSSAGAVRAWDSTSRARMRAGRKVGS